MVLPRKVYKPLALASINKNVLKFRYDVRGPIVSRAYELEAQLKSNPKSLPFEKLVMCNIGNPQALAQVPITYMRQMLAACLFPEILDKNLFPKDIARKVNEILGENRSIGAYTHSQGYISVRNSVAQYLFSRDKYKSDPEDIFLSNGATQAIKRIIQMLIASNTDGILVPIPQYPLYSASIEMFGGKLIGYRLDEKRHWSIDLQAVENTLEAAQKEGVRPRAFCVINPGNPAGQVLSLESIRAIIDFCHRHNLVILADEVYQHNVYSQMRPFHSFRSALLFYFTHLPPTLTIKHEIPFLKV